MRQLSLFDFLLIFCLILQFSAKSQKPGDYFKIIVRDKATGRGVPLVELKTTNQVSYYTDNNGVIAYFEPGLMNEEVYFHIRSHGYEFPVDGFGYRGKALLVTPGDSSIFYLKRINIAERLYRITGEGCYNDSWLTGYPVPVRQPLLNGRVLGQDTFIETLYKGKIYWFWGDTDRPSYPLGNFATSGATSDLPEKGGPDPDYGVDLTYFLDEKGFSKKMCPLEGPGPVWIHWLTVLSDSLGTEKLICSYTRVKTLGNAYEQGLALFNDKKELFEPFIQFIPNSPLFPEGHSFRANVNGKEYIYFSFASPYTLRVPANLKDISDLRSYEAFTCLPEGLLYDTASVKIDRNSDRSIVYKWKKNTEPLNDVKEQALLKKGLMHPGETFFNMCDLLTGQPVASHSGSVYWNNYRQKWIMIFEERFGTSPFGEVWYAEADSPTGPWVYALKIVTHDKYTFYNVGQHPLFDRENGRIIYFEGTYTNSFSGNPEATPRYNYNQIMYRLDLSIERLFMPSPVYRINDGKGKPDFCMREEADSTGAWNRLEEIPFFAIPSDRTFQGLVPVFKTAEKGKTRLTTNPPRSGKKLSGPLFFALPLNHPLIETPEGIWDCKAGDFPLTFDLKLENGIVKGTIESDALIIESGTYNGKNLKLTVKDTVKTERFEVSLTLSADSMIGKFKASDGDDMGSFRAKRRGEKWENYVNSMTVCLYEFRDSSGNFFYSTEQEYHGMEKSEKPVCRVWKNPSSLIHYDFKVKPVILSQLPN